MVYLYKALLTLGFLIALSTPGMGALTLTLIVFILIALFPNPRRPRT